MPTCLPAGAPFGSLSLLRAGAPTTPAAVGGGGSVVDARSGERLAVPLRALVRAVDGAVCDGVTVIRPSVIDPTDPSALATMTGAFCSV